MRDEGSGFPDFGQQRGREGGGGLRPGGQQGGELAGVQPAAGLGPKSARQVGGAVAALELGRGGFAGDGVEQAALAERQA